MSGGIVVFDALQFVLVVVIVRQRWRDFKEEKGGIERLTNTLSKLSNDAASLTVILFTDDPVERLHHVGATVALAWVATVAWPPCLSAGAVARDAGTNDQTEAASEVLSCLLTFTIPMPRGGYTCCERGGAHAKHAFDKKGVLSGASSVRSNRRTIGNWSWQRLLVIVVFRLGRCIVRNWYACD